MDSIEKGKYYKWICSQIQALKYYHQSLKQDLLSVAEHYFDTVDEQEFNHSFEWAVSDLGFID